MPWYRFHITSVNGKDQIFRWIEEDLGEDDESELKYQLDSWVETTTVAINGYHGFTAGYERVATLPPDIRQQMIDETKRKIEVASNLLDQLRMDAIKNPPPEEEGVDSGGWIGAVRHEVTHGIFAAEEADMRAARAWENVEKSQATLARYVDGVERLSARQGSQIARERAKKRREHR